MKQSLTPTTVIIAIVVIVAIVGMIGFFTMGKGGSDAEPIEEGDMMQETKGAGAMEMGDATDGGVGAKGG